ncbi:hypothetical protein PO002_45060 [Cupriavidus necator]|uniref:hypothetical protein n=1 Tax=Cupriavidus necator TaxID=106590 RepID=UPI0039C01228
MNAKLLAVALAAATLTACGGGGDTPTTGGDTTTTPVTPTTKISGTAATGAALAGATVQAKCATGSGSATTAGDGTFTLNIENAVRPCVLSVQVPDGPVMHSIVEAGTGTSAVANVTPLTELVTAALVGGSTTDFFNTFDSAAQAKVTSDGVSSAVSAVSLSLSGTVDLTGFNPVTDTLVAAHGGSAGNALDQAIDKLGAALEASGTSLEELSTAVAANPGSTNGPIQTVLQASAASCSSLRSGKYFSVNTAENFIEVAVFDAAKMTLTYPFDGAVDNLVPHATEACRFSNTDAEYPSEIVVGKGGIALIRELDGPKHVPRLLVPAQQISLEKKAGDWVGLTYGSTPSFPNAWIPSRVYITFDAAGKVTAGSRCYSGQSCNASTQADFPVINAGSEGLSTTMSSTYGSGFMISFMGTDGKMAMFATRPGGFTVYTQAMPLPLPVVNAETRYWDSVTDYTGTMSAFTSYTNRVTAVDEATKTYTRTRLEDGRVDSWTADKPTVGMRYRQASPGASEAYGIRLGGTTGLAAVISANPNQNFYSLSVDRP